jgi:hypothetical protein
MKRSLANGIFAVLMAVSIVTGCMESFQDGSEKDILAIEEYPGVYLTNDISALPLATSGYDIYLIGERCEC